MLKKSFKTQNGKLYLLYVTAGEQTIGNTELNPIH